MTLLLLRNSLISFYQSLNFVLSLLNYPGSGIMPFGIPACVFSLVTAGAVDISVSAHSSSLETSSMIFKDPSLSDNALILFVLLEVILSCSHSFHYMCFVSLTGNSA